MKRISTILILFILLLSACNNQETTATPESATAEPTEAATAVPPTIEPTTEPTQEMAEVATEMVDVDMEALLANPWQWVSFTNPAEQFDLETPEAYLLQFNEDGTVNVVADCNNAGGSYTVDGSSLTIEIGPMTMAACPPESRSDQFVAYLGSAAIYFFEDGNLHLDLMADGGTMVFAPADAETTAGNGDVTYVCTESEAFADCAGPSVVVGQVSSANVAFLPELFPNPSILLLDVTSSIGGQDNVFVPDTGQTLGLYTKDLFPLPGEYQINLPIKPTGSSLDVDNDGVEETGVQIYAMAVGSNLFGSSYLQQLEQQTGLRSYLTDIVTGKVSEGTFLVHAADAEQSFPATPGDDGIWFTADDPSVPLPAGYTLVTLPKEGAITLDRSSQVTMNSMEHAERAAPDFSDQGILESYNSLIDTLIDRYAYTELRGLDWEAIRAEYLPRVEQADADQNFGAYLIVLQEIAASINDSHVTVSSRNPTTAEEATALATPGNVAGVGASVFGAWDETEETLGQRILVLTVGEGTPAAEAGWVPGTEIVSVNGQPALERAAEIQLPGGIGTEVVRLEIQIRTLLRFPEGEPVTIEFRLPDSDQVLSATMTPGAYSDGSEGASLPEVYKPSVDFYFIDEYAVITWSDFVNDVLTKISVLEEALGAEQRIPSGSVILDLRGNSGGWVTLYETMASYFFAADNPMQVHVFDSYYFDQAAGKHVKVFAGDYMASAPRPELAYTGPLVILVDQNCTSACEFFSQHLQLLGRATIIGQYPSNGAGGNIDRASLPGGITFQFTTGQSYFAGTDVPNLEAKGVVPDVRVPVTLETEQAIMRGEDPVMDAAVDFLRNNNRLSNTTWRWTSTVDPTGSSITPIESDADYLITFNADYTLSVTADCNQVQGTYEVGDGGAISISLGAATLALCPDGSLGEQFVAYLSTVIGFGFEDANLGLIVAQPADILALYFDPVDMPDAESMAP